MSLHGTLETFALADVLVLLGATKKTGELRVTGDHADGRIWLDGGQIVAADVPRAPGNVDAVFELLRLKTGKFAFDGDSRPGEPEEPVAIEPVLLEAQARLSEWQGIEAVVPSLSCAVRLAQRIDGPQVTVSSEQWRALVSVAANRDVNGVVEALGTGEFASCRMLKDLVETGLVGVDQVPAEPEPAPPAAPAETAATVAPPSAQAPPAPARPTPAPARPTPAPPAGRDAPRVAPVAAALRSLRASADEAGGEAGDVAGEEAPVVATNPSGTPRLVGSRRPRIAAFSGDENSAGMEPSPPAPRIRKPRPAAEPAEPAEDAPAAAAAAADVVDHLWKMQASAQGEAEAQAPSVAGAATVSAAPPALEGAAAGDDEKEGEEPPAPNPEEGGGEPINRGLLLKFLSSVRN